LYAELPITYAIKCNEIKSNITLASVLQMGLNVFAVDAFLVCCFFCTWFLDFVTYKQLCPFIFITATFYSFNVDIMLNFGLFLCFILDFCVMFLFLSSNKTENIFIRHFTNVQCRIRLIICLFLFYCYLNIVHYWNRDSWMLFIFLCFCSWICKYIFLFVKYNCL